MFHDELKKARLAKNMTQEEATKAIGTTLRTYCRWERGEGFPSFHHAKAIQSFFGLNLSESA